MSPGGHEGHGTHDHSHGQHAGPSRLDRALVVFLTLAAFTLIFRTQLASVSAWRADNLYANGKDRAGLSVVTRGLLLKPDDLPLLDLAGALHERLGQLSQAEAAYRRVLAYRPGSAEHWRLIGAIRFEQKRYASAVPYYRRAVELDSSQLLSWRGLAVAQERAGMLADAIATWEAFARRFPAYDGASQANRLRSRAGGRR